MTPQAFRFWANTWSAMRGGAYKDLLPGFSKSTRVPFIDYLRNSPDIDHPAVAAFFREAPPVVEAEYMIAADMESGARPAFLLTSHRLVLRDPAAERYAAITLEGIIAASDVATPDGYVVTVETAAEGRRKFGPLFTAPEDAVLERAIARAKSGANMEDWAPPTDLLETLDDAVAEFVDSSDADTPADPSDEKARDGARDRSGGGSGGGADGRADDGVGANDDADAPVGELVAFHGAIIVLLGLWVTPAVQAILVAVMGSSSIALYSDLTSADILMLSFATLIPAVLAFGTSLTFSLKRFAVGIGVSLVASSLIAAKLTQRAGGLYDPVPSMDALLQALPATLAGAVFWLVPAWGIGRGSVWLAARLRRWGRWAPTAGLILLLAAGAAPFVTGGGLGFATGQPIAEAMAQRDGYGQLDTRVRGEGTITWVHRYGRDGREHIQVSFVALPDGREVALIEDISPRFFRSKDLHALEVGDRVRFQGIYFSGGRYSERISLISIMGQMKDWDGPARQIDDGVYIYGYGAKDGAGVIERLD